MAANDTNASKARKALNEVLACTYTGLDGRFHAELDEKVIALCRDAVATPARNCDRGGFYDVLRNYYRTDDSIPSAVEWDWFQWNKFCLWLFKRANKG